MTFKLLFAAAALSTALTGAALAQSQPSSPDPATTDPQQLQPGAITAPENDSDMTGSITGAAPAWDDATNDVFYADGAAGTLRSKEEAMSRWVNLSAEQQARVKQDCQDARAPSNGGDSALGSPGLNELCTWVNTM